MDQIEPESLYDERGNVNWARPLLQGDVFDGIVLPGFGDQPMKVQIISHPCAMRRGANLTPRITVAPVEPHSLVAGQRGWDENLRVMPLPELIEEKHFAPKFIDVTAAPAVLLARPQRIATLSHEGIYVLQQRLIKHYTRVEMSLELLRRQSAAVLTEAVLQWEWIEEVLTEAELADESAIEAEAKVFDTWLGEGDPSCRALLRSEIHHTDVRRRALRAARDRSRTRQDQK
jgi:hypothetical protein